jgi:uncharacterized protein YegP (UPF0339 family)
VSKLLCGVLLAAVVAGLAGGSGVAPAQDKKEAKKDTKAAKAAGTIEVNEGKDGKYRFLVRDAEGKLLAMSGPGGYETKAEAVKAVDTLKAVLPGAKVAEAKKDGKN